MGVVINEDDWLAHYGTKRHSGRYPYGSGGDDASRHRDFLGQVAALKKQGLTEAQIAEGMGLESTTKLRAMKSIAKNAEKQHKINQAERLRATGMSVSEVGREMGINESSVRSLLAPGVKEKADILQTTANMLRDTVEERGVIDVGSGVELHLGISDTRLKTAVSMLEEEGYKVHYVKIQQVGTGKPTTVKVLAKPDEVWSDIVRNPDRIKPAYQYSEDRGRTFTGIKPPLNIDPKRIAVNYKEDGGADADGVIYVRRGVDDLSLGGANYAQVRVAVGGTHYLKGMAIYRDDLPKGVDLVFNTNKSSTGNKLDAMKPLKVDKETGKVDEENPFGAIIRQIGERNAKGELTKVTSAMNLVNEEGDWGKWSKSIATQVLSKQKPQLAKQQLDKAFKAKREDLDEILSITNPAVKKKLLETFADGADSAAVHLKAKAMPRQRTQVILPINSLKDTEIFAPNFRHGENVVLIRYPHGGIFEIPELKVNNNNPEGNRIIGKHAKDAVGINSSVAAKLSGADFDGDTVLVIPNNGKDFKTAPSLEGLKKFDPQSAYPPYDGMKTIDGGIYNAKTKEVDYGGKRPNPQGKGTQMGLVSNLITDMTIMKAPDSELARAVRHSMVVIDAEKHHLDYKHSAEVNGIPALMKKYQNRSQGGGSTLISRAKSPARVNEFELRKAAKGGPIDRETGKLVREETGASYINKQGKLIVKTTEVERLAITDDARTLISDANTRIERIYADHSNRLKAMANEARREYVSTKNTPYSPSAKKIYAEEVKKLNADLNLALRNRPLERRAQILAGTQVAAKKAANPEMDAAEIKKLKSMALVEARRRVGADKNKIEITDRQWEAIQAGAITNHKLSEILRYADLDRVRELATPRPKSGVSIAQLQRADQLINQGKTRAEVADILGISVTTMDSAFKERDGE